MGPGTGQFDANLPDRNLKQVTLYGPAGERAETRERRVQPDGSSTWITTSYAYDNLGRVITTTRALTSGVVASTTASYDALSQVVYSTDPLGHKTRTDYDALHRPVTVTVNYVDGAFDPAKPDEDLITVTTYDSAGNRVQVKDPKGIVTQYEYDLLNRLTAVVENYVSGGPQNTDTNVRTTYAYDAAGNLASIADGRGKVTRFTYDLLNRQLSATDPLTHTTVYTYNAAGDQIGLQDANGQVTSLSYDLLDRLTAVDYPGSTPDVAYGYNVLGLRTVMTDGTGTGPPHGPMTPSAVR